MSKIINITSIRSGTGKSTIASHVASQLVEQGKKILVVDNNLENSDMEKYLRVNPEYGVDDVKPYIQAQTLTEEILESLLCKVKNNLFLLGGTKLSGIDNTLSIAEIESLAKTLVSFDYIIIDSKTLAKNKSLEFIKGSDYNIYVLPPNEIWAKEFHKFTDIVKQNQKDLLDKIYVAINKYHEGITFNSRTLNIKEKRILKLPYDVGLANFPNGFEVKVNDSLMEFNNRLFELLQETTLAQQEKIKKFNLKELIGNFKLS